MSANFATPNGVSNVLIPLDHRFMRKEPTTLSRVLPAAIAVEVKIDPAVIMLATKKLGNEDRGPNPIPKQQESCQCKTRSPAKSASHLECTDASTRPSFATAK